MTLQRRGAAPELPGDLRGRHGAGCQHCLRRRDLDGAQRRRATADAPTGTAGCQCGSGRWRRSSASNCRRVPQMLRIKPPCRAGGVDGLLHRPQTDAACRQGVHGPPKLAHGSPDGRAGQRPAHRRRERIPGRQQAAGVARCMWSGWPLAAEMNLRSLWRDEPHRHSS